MIDSIFVIGSAIAGIIGWAYLLYRLNWGLDGLVSKMTDAFFRKVTYSDMGKASGDARFRSSVERKTQEALLGFAPKLLNNPLLEMGIEYILNETELGDVVREDPRALPIIFGYLSKLVNESGGIDQLLNMSVDMSRPKTEPKSGYE